MTIRVIDANSHVLEPPELWHEYVPNEFRVAVRQALWWTTGPHGDVVIVNGRPVAASSALCSSAGAWRPDGGRAEAVQFGAAGQLNPGASIPSARLADMDRMAIDQAIVFPTLLGEYLPRVDHPELAAILATAYNDWVFDFCQESANRLVPAAVLPLQNVDHALRELDRVVAGGFGLAVLNPVFYEDRYLNHPSFDPLWAALERQNVVAVVRPHAGLGAPEWSSHGPFVERVHRVLNLGHPVSQLFAPMMDASTTLVALLYYAHLERFPGLRLVIANARASWLPLALEKAEGYLTQNPATEIPVRTDSDRLFRERDVGIVFDTGERVVERLWDEFAPAAMWGSRYPAIDTTLPQDAMAGLRAAGAPESAVAAMLGENASRLYGLGVGIG